VSSGGDKGLGAVRAYLESATRHNPQNPSPPDVAIAIEDRNYRPLAEVNATWANARRRSFIWRRHEIENYLLHPRLVLEMFNGFRGAGQSWAAKLPVSEADVNALLQTLALQVIENHAAEVLRTELVQTLNPLRLSFGPPRPNIRDQAHWLPALENEAARLCNDCATASALSELQRTAIATRYQQLLAVYQQPSFFASGDYLRDLGGHELLATLGSHLSGLVGGAISQQLLEDELLTALDRVYQPNALFQPDDFAELAAILAQY
jgi:hypothetical protein